MDETSYYEGLAAGYQDLKQASSEAEQYKKLVCDFFAVLDIVEESDSGYAFHPNRISSCRVMDGVKLTEILLALRKLAGLPDLEQDPT